MSRILGLDLGSSSIGWAVVDLNSKDHQIVKIGSRIIPLTTDDETQFSKGQAITKNADRTRMRTARKVYDRYQMRRTNLKKILAQSGITPTAITKPIDLWKLRSLAVTEKVSLNELGRVLLHINQKRGYKAGKSDYSDSSSSKYVLGINEGYRYLQEEDITLGQFFYKNLLSNGSFRVKDRVYPRKAYIDEFDKIIETQKKYYPETITESFIHRVKDETIFYQRKLKSCKHLVSLCNFEKKEYVKADGNVVTSGPKVAPKSSPVTQLCKIWEFVNTITISNYYGDNLPISKEQKKELANLLSINSKLKISDIQKIVGVSKKDGWIVDKTISQRSSGNTTLIKIADALNGKYPDLLEFNVHFDEIPDKETGEIKQIVSESIKTEPLFRLWHTLYSISDDTELRNVLETKFGIKDELILDSLCKLDFVKEGYAGKSNTAMRKILPFLMDGLVYSDACEKAGYRHCSSLTKDENRQRVLKESLSPIQKGELRQPIVEKILNQTVNVVNALIKEYGQFDEIRVELARELKQSREEREKISQTISKNEKENKELAEMVTEYGFTPTRNRILKMKLWRETNHLCIYCNQPVSAKEFLSGIDVEKEHIVPRSVLFDNSSSNVTCACRRCNQDKGNMTAYDFIKSKGESTLEEYVNRVSALFEAHKISKAKHDKLLMSSDALPTDFIERQLRETQYVSKKAMEMLKEICRNVCATSGSVTDFLRHTWGWDDVLQDLHFNQYKSAGLTETKEFVSNGCTRTKEVISGWSKRFDHRHHAIDALTIACTSQTIIQQLNTLNTLKDVPFSAIDAQNDAFKEKHTKLERFALSQPHFTTEEVKSAIDDTLISFKSGKKVATPGKRYIYSGGKRILRQRTLVPRGALSEQTVYGKIHHNGQDEIVVKQSVSNLDSKSAEKIVDEGIKKITIDYLNRHKGKYDPNDPMRDFQGNIIRSVRILTGLDAIVPVRKNEKGEAISFVKPGNNHHIAIYQDADGNYYENVVTFWHAVERKKCGLPIVIEDPKKIMDNLRSNIPESFTSQLPAPDWKFVISLQSNESFVLGMTESDYQEAIRANDNKKLSKHLYRVQKIAKRDYVFRLHLETSVDDKINGVKNEKLSQALGKFIRITSIKGLLNLNPHKIHISILGSVK